MRVSSNSIENQDDDGGMHPDDGDKLEVDENAKSEEEREEDKIRKAEEKWKHKIRHNGKSYMEKLKKI